MAVNVHVIIARAGLQSRLDSELQKTGECVIRGSQEIDGPIYVRYPGRVTFIDATLRPTVVWDPKNAVLVITGRDVVLVGDLTIDERGQYRASVNSVGQSVLLTNLQKFDASGLRLRCLNTGIARSLTTLEPVRSIIENNYDDTLENLFEPTDLPSGPDVLFLALDALGDFYSEGTYLGAVGPCRRGSFGSIELERTQPTQRAFGVRFASNFAENRAYDSFANRCEEIEVGSITVRGEYDWNAVEMVGTGTRAVKLGLVQIYAKTGCGLDFDKGASRCRADRVEIYDSGKTDRYVGDTQIRFSAAAIHGVGPSQTTDDCSIGELIVRNATSDSEDVYESGFFCQYASNVSIERVDIDGVNDGAFGVGVLVDTGVDQVRIGHLRARNVVSGIATNAGGTVGDILVDRVDVESTGTPLAFSVTGSSGRVQIGGGRVKPMNSLGGGVPHISLTAGLARADVGPVDISGGGASAIGIFCMCRATVIGASVRGQAYGVQGYGASAHLRCVGVDASTSTVLQMVETDGGVVTGSGNSWEDS